MAIIHNPFQKVDKLLHTKYINLVYNFSTTLILKYGRDVSCKSSFKILENQIQQIRKIMNVL